MKTNRALTIAHKVLSLRNQIVADHLRARSDAAVQFVESRATVVRHQRDIAMARLSVIEATARVQQQLPQKPVDPIQQIVDRHARAIVNLEARASLRSEVEHQLRSQAAQAAFDRAEFVDQVKQRLPEEMWDETIDTYDRRVYEAGDGGST